MYIGQTVKELEDRVKTHHQKGVKTKTKLYDATRKYGWSNFEFEIIDHAETKEDLDKLEIFYIEKYNTITDGYNLALGGGINPMDSEEVKSKHYRSMQSAETRQKISQTMKRVRSETGFSDETRKNISDGLARFYAEGNKPNYSKPQQLSDSQKLALLKSKIKTVWAEREDGTEVGKFEQVYDGARWWKANGYDISEKQLCHRIKQSADNEVFIRGIKWHYEKLCV